MKVKTWAAVAATTAGLAAAPAVAQGQNGQQEGQNGQQGGQNGQQGGQNGQQGGQNQERAVRAFLRASARSNLFEIQSSELALEEARSATTRRLARLLIRHHTAMQAMVAEQAQEQEVEIPTTLTSRQTADLRRLQRASRGTFDRTYLRIQVSAHELSARLHLSAARAELPAEVRVLAIEALPVIGNHLGRASELLRTAGGSGQGGSGQGGSGQGGSGQGGSGQGGSGQGGSGQGGSGQGGSGSGSGS
jgi:putative membrane protein